MMLKPSSASSSLKNHKVFVLGLKKVGKTCLLDQLVYGGRANYNLPKDTETLSNVFPMDNHGGAITDIYSCVVDSGSLESATNPGVTTTTSASKERVHFFDTPGFQSVQPFAGIETLRNYVNYADAFLLVYAINSRESFSLIELLKKSIDKLREKRDIPILVLGNKVDKFRERQVDSSEAAAWATKEKVRLLEVTATERATIIEPLIFLVSRLSPTSSSVSLGKGSLGSAFGSKLSAKKTTSNITLEL